jgi:hypothetical protein
VIGTPDRSLVVFVEGPIQIQVDLTHTPNTRYTTEHEFVTVQQAEGDGATYGNTRLVISYVHGANTTRLQNI